MLLFLFLVTETFWIGRSSVGDLRSCQPLYWGSGCCSTFWIPGIHSTRSAFASYPACSKTFGVRHRHLAGEASKMYCFGLLNQISFMAL